MAVGDPAVVTVLRAALAALLTAATAHIWCASALSPLARLRAPGASRACAGAALALLGLAALAALTSVRMQRCRMRTTWVSHPARSPGALTNAGRAARQLLEALELPRPAAVAVRTARDVALVAAGHACYTLSALVLASTAWRGAGAAAVTRLVFRRARSLLGLALLSLGARPYIWWHHAIATTLSAPLTRPLAQQPSRSSRCWRGPGRRLGVSGPSRRRQRLPWWLR